ncbi:lipocalin family protein [Croceivirga thetidis]|uniref:Lipocalin-like domain-containing protein n=1 Tax=Croceivirga thetidis TaxID=2721623 RepID=A0ABX1GL84_9FLAO|nr:lipocalin family protein [Croceivirga thetidis]NKI30665.1 hypothetical protein [Croceivirga thetidis]
MKKIGCLICLSLLFFACSTDGDENENTVSGIVGSWTAISLNGAVGFDLNGDGTSSNNVLEELPCFESSINFNEDGTYSATTSDIAFSGTGLTDIMADCDGTTDENGIYSFSGTSLTIDPDDDEPSTVDVVLVGDTLTINEVDDEFGPVTLVLQRN